MPAADAADTAASTTDTGPKLRPTPRPSQDYPELLVVDPAHYVITREIARGGMGRIHVARDRRLGREVAVKEVLTGSGALARRFEREVRITAGLQHPSIISVHEAGTWPSGEPFYAMRLVQGRSLDEVIAATTTFEERLALLPNILAIADAMAYAHERRVIHRDLKPRNVVLGEFGETVVIDWGLAKHLEQADSVDAAISGAGALQGETTVGDIIGTPAYMPPEQAAGEPVDERADVYAIGAILYHALAGRPPFVGSTAEVIAAVHGEPPRPLLELAPSSPGELVTIVERAMARDRSQRYATARALAEDLRRFQTGQLVGAHRYSLRQLLRRWLARHRTLVIATASAAIVAVGIGVLALNRIFDAEGLAEVQRVRATTNQQSAEGLMKFMLDDLRPKLEQVGKLDLLDAVARRAVGYYDGRGDTGSDEDTLLSAVARIDIAEVMVSRGDLPAAKLQLDKAKAKLDPLVAGRPAVVRYQLAAIDVRGEIGKVEKSQGDLAAALASYRDALGRAELLALANPNDDDVLRTLHTGHAQIGSTLVDRGDLDHALVEYRSALAIAVERARRVTDPAVEHELFDSHADLGDVLYRRNDLDDALAEYRTALATGEREAAADPKDMIAQDDLATCHEAIGKILYGEKQLPGALAELRAAYDVYDRLVKFDPTNTERLMSRAGAADQVIAVLLDQHDVPAALRELQSVYQMYVALTARDPSNAAWQRNLSVVSNRRGDVQLAAHDTAGALESYRGALAIRETLVAKDPARETWRRDLFYSHIKLAGLYDKMPGKQPEMVAELRAALVIAENVAARNPTNPASQDDLANTHIKLGLALIATHDRDGGRAEYRAALAIAERLAETPNADDWKKLSAEIKRELAK